MPEDQTRDDSKYRRETLWHQHAWDMKKELRAPDEGKQEYQTQLQRLERDLLYRAQTLAVQATTSIGSREGRSILTSAMQEVDEVELQLDQFKANRLLAVRARTSANRKAHKDIDKTLREGLLAQYRAIYADFGIARMTEVYAQIRIPSLVVTLRTTQGQSNEQSSFPATLPATSTPTPSSPLSSAPDELSPPAMSLANSRETQPPQTYAVDAIDEEINVSMADQDKTGNVHVDVTSGPREVSVLPVLPEVFQQVLTLFYRASVRRFQHRRRERETQSGQSVQVIRLELVLLWCG